jgi:SAM-dependent methyltransferase
MTALERVAASLVSRPAVYRLVQTLAGQRRVAERLRRSLPEAPAGSRFLDLGSSEGSFAAYLRIDPIFVDLDPRPLLTLRTRRPGSRVVAADAGALPFPDAAFDVTLCVAVAHHLDDSLFERVAAEIARVTRSHFVFLDPLRDEKRAVSRWLWRYDRGRFPRTRAEIERRLASHFSLSPPEEFAVFHRYVLWVGAPLRADPLREKRGSRR